jgi:signal transduction histidine kinase
MVLRKFETDNKEDYQFLLARILEQSTAMVNGDYSLRTVTDVNDDALTKIANNLNILCDKAQLDCSPQGGDLEQTVTTFIEVISSFTNLDFKQKLPISENGTVMDAIATGINMLGDELENSTASRTELEKERNRLNEAQSLAKVGSWEIHKERGKFSLSREACRIFGLDPESEHSFQEAYRHFRRTLPPEDLVKVKSFLSHILETKGRYSFETRVWVNDHTQKHILCIGEILRNELDDTVEVIKGTVQDITESKLVEEALKDAKIKAEDLHQAKSRFLANMSHEIRTPLNGMLGLTEIMLNETENPEHKKYLDLIRYSGKNLTQLINDTLDLSKIESGKLELENIPFNFRHTITANITPYEFLAQQKGCILTYRIDEAIPADVVGDPTRISQIIINLLSNAIKFTEEGNIDVSFNLHKLERDQIFLKGTVKDNGIGIPADRIGTIFKTFSQADESITRKYGGSGLGLSIVKNLLLLMGGDINVESISDEIDTRGTTFTFYFSVKAHAVTTKHEVDSEKGTGSLTFSRPIHILLVDDNKINLLVAKKLLETLGAKVTTALNGVEAIDRVRDMGEFDIILMDIQMPELNGYEATVRLREMAYARPIVALSANAFPEDVKNSLASGMNDHIQKPFTGALLLKVIGKYI